MGREGNINSTALMRYLGLVLCVFLFMATLWLPIIEMNTLFVQPMKLHNLHKPTRPSLSEPSAFLTGELQKKLSVWFLRRHGFWGHMVRLDNQFNLEVFNQISSKYQSALAVGANKWLFQRDYLDHFNRVSLPSQELLESRALRIKRLQELLSQRGIGFAVVLSTSKIEAFPELVPASFVAAKRLQRPSTHDRVVPMLSQLGIRLIDAQQILGAKEGRAPEAFFTPAGSHWNDVGACVLASEIVAEMNDALRRPSATLDCAEVVVEPSAKNTDLDLVIMANLWNRDRYTGATPYPRPQVTREEGAYTPKILMVGSSFGWSLMRFLDSLKLIQNSYFWYYYKRARHYPTKRQFQLKRDSINWERDLFSADFVLIEANLMGLDNIGFEFVEDAIHALESVS